MIDWSKISNPHSFEALCAAILAFEDPTARVFKRSGPDFGIDAISADGSTVYQFKFHTISTPSSIRRDAEAELKKISGHLNGKDSTAKSIWASVKRWILVTNSTLNPNIENNWKKVQKDFSECNLIAELWSGEDLENLIRKHRPIYNEFFVHEVRPYLTLTEAEALLRESSFRKDEYVSSFFGRQEQLSLVKSFLENNDQRILLIHGPGGTGKTRFLLEAGKIAQEIKEEQVYWANTATLASDKNFLGGIIPEKSHTVLIDEPEDIRFLNVLLEQISLPNSRIRDWKVIISVREHNASVLKVFSSLKSCKYFQDMELKALERQSIEKIVEEQIAHLSLNLGRQEKDQLKNKIVSISGGHPIWVHIALKVLENGESVASLPEDNFNVVARYVSQSINSAPETLAEKSKLQELVFWIALFSEISVKNDQMLSYIGSQLKLADSNTLYDLLSFLCEIGLAKRFGSLIKIKPDVVRDNLQLTSVVRDVNTTKIELSGFGRKVQDQLKSALQGKTIPQFSNLIKNLDYVDLYTTFAKEKVGILSDFISSLLQGAKSNDASEQYAITKIASDFALSAPSSIVDLVSIIMNNPSASKDVETDLLGSINVTFEHVMRELPQLLLEASRYEIEEFGRKNITKLATQLLSIESKNTKGVSLYNQNDGKRAKNVVEKQISGGPGFLRPYQAEYEAIAIEEISKIKNGLIENPTFYKHLLEPLISLRRGHSVFNKGTVTITRYFVSADSEAYASRTKIVECIWELLREDTPQQARNVLFEILDIAHSDLHRAFAESGVSEFETAELAELKKLQILIKKTWLTRTDLREARKIWDWHFSYDKRSDFRRVSQECEKFYLSDSEAKVFDQIFQWRYGDQTPPKNEVQDYIESLLNNPSGSLITNAVIAAAEFAGTQQFWHGAQTIYEFLVENYEHEAVENFVKANLHSEQELTKDFARLVVSLRLCSLRKMGEAAKLLRLLNWAVDNSRTENDKLDLLTALYVRPTLPTLGAPLKQEFELLIKTQDEFVHRKRTVDFVAAITNAFHVDLERYKQTIDNLLGQLDAKDAQDSVSCIINTLHMFELVEKHTGIALPKTLSPWVFAKLSVLPNLKGLGGHVDYNLHQLLKHSGWRPNFVDFKDFLLKRIELAKNGGEKVSIVPGVSFDILEYFKKLPDSSVPDSLAISTFKFLLELNDAGYPVGHRLPEWCMKFDPDGTYLPDLVSQQIEKLDPEAEVETIYLWSRYAAAYSENSAPWTKIAAKLGEKFAHLTGEKRRSLLWTLAHHSSEVWSGTYGQFHPRWKDAVNEQQRRFDASSNDFIKEFFKLRLESAKADLAREEERFAEEHGDE